MNLDQQVLYSSEGRIIPLDPDRKYGALTDMMDYLAAEMHRLISSGLITYTYALSETKTQMPDSTLVFLTLAVYPNGVRYWTDLAELDLGSDDFSLKIFSRERILVNPEGLINVVKYYAINKAQFSFFHR